jgi:hypothetical protein
LPVSSARKLKEVQEEAKNKATRNSQLYEQKSFPSRQTELSEFTGAGNKIVFQIILL